MTKHLFVFLAGTALLAVPLLAQNESGLPGTPAHLIVTVEAKHEKQPPPSITQQDVMAYSGKERLAVTGWLPLQGEHAGLQLMILLDDGSGVGLSTQLNDLRDFITAQPATTSIAVGYMRNGTVQFTSQFTQDHAQAAKSLRVPIGQAGINGSPYFSLSDVVKRWPDGPERHEVLMITDGIDRYGIGTGLDDPYVNAAISDAQRKGIVVFSIYTRGMGHFGHSFWRNSWGQNFLSQLSDETGGESFYIGIGNPVSFKPYLDELSERLTHQYLLTITMKPAKKADLRPIKLQTEVPNADLAHQDRVWVRAGT
jgi:hypothetical protein